MALPLLQPDDARARLSYARTRADDLIGLNGGDLLGADAHERQRLTQEVFFHLIGAIEVFAQLVNEQRALGRPSEDVSISRLAGLLPSGDGLVPLVTALYANTRNPPPPAASDPYSGDGLMYRIWNYRHQVTHRRANPFHAAVTLHAQTSVGTARNPTQGSWFQTHVAERVWRSRPLPNRSGHFILDPRDPGSTPSTNTVQVDIDAMYGLITDRLEAAIAAI